MKKLNHPSFKIEQMNRLLGFRPIVQNNSSEAPFVKTDKDTSSISNSSENNSSNESGSDTGSEIISPKTVPLLDLSRMTNSYPSETTHNLFYYSDSDSEDSEDLDSENSDLNPDPFSGYIADASSDLEDTNLLTQENVELLEELSKQENRREIFSFIHDLKKYKLLTQSNFELVGELNNLPELSIGLREISNLETIKKIEEEKKIRMLIQKQESTIQCLNNTISEKQSELTKLENFPSYHLTQKMFYLRHIWELKKTNLELLNRLYDVQKEQASSPYPGVRLMTQENLERLMCSDNVFETIQKIKSVENSNKKSNYVTRR